MAFSFASLFARPADPDMGADDEFARESAQLTTLKQEALGLAKELAASENREPNLTDYFRSALSMTERAEEMGLRWDGRVIANLSNLTLDGFTVRKADIYPDAQQRADMRDVMPAREKREGVTAMRDMHDLDGDGAVADFYTEVQAQLRCDHTKFLNCTFQPATTLEIVDNGRGAQFGNVTFDGMGAEDTLTLGSGKHGGTEKFHGVHFKNIQGGTVVVNDYAIVNDLYLEGQTTALHIGGRAQVNDLHADGAHIVKLSADPGARIERAVFNGATIDLASDLTGSVWTNAEFKNANLRDVNFAGATLSGAHFEGTDLKGVNFKGARLSNVSFQDTELAGVDFTSAQLHNIRIIGTDPITGQATNQRVDSHEQLAAVIRQQESFKAAGLIGSGVLAPQLASIGLATEPAPATVSASEQQAPAASVIPTRIAFAGNVTLDDVALSKTIAEMARPESPDKGAEGFSRSLA